MTADDFTVLKEISDSSYEVAVLRKHGAEGVKTLRRVLSTAVEVLKVLPYELFTEGITIMAPTDADVSPSHDEEVIRLTTVQELSGRMNSAMTLCIIGPRQFFAWPSSKSPGHAVESFIAYKYVHGVGESILTNESTWQIEQDTPFACSKAAPTFGDLEGALLHYAAVTRHPEYCSWLQQAWRDPNRIAFLPKPEHLLRRSLFNALRSSLRTAQVREEQNQDDRKPVDIEVTWWDGRRAALVEVKWMGKSGPAGGGFNTQYDPSSVIRGLTQLDDYLERRRGSTPNVSVIGHLFVFDARRRGIRSGSTEVSVSNGGYYRNRDVSFPEALLRKSRIGIPVRCFLEPVTTQG